MIWMDWALRPTAWAISGASIGCLAWILAAKLTYRSSRLQALAAAFMWIFLATAFTFLLGLLGLLRPLPMALVPALLLGIAIMGRSGRERLRDAAKRMCCLSAAMRSLWTELPGWLKLSSIVLGLAGSMRVLFLIPALPPFVWDSLTYHLTNVAQWIQDGRISLFVSPVTRIYSPANFEVLSSWFTVFLHHDAFVEAAGLPAYLLACLAVYYIGRSLGLSRAGSWASALSYAFTPSLLLAATGTKNDPHMAAYFLAGLAILLEFKREMDKLASNESSPAETLILLFLIFLLALGTKTYALHLALGGLLVLVIPFFPGEQLQAWPEKVRGLFTSLRDKGNAARAPLLGLLAVGIALGFFWNLRNWRLTGNPFYPYRVLVGGEELLTGTGSPPIVTGFDQLLENLALFAWKFGDRQAPITPDLPNTTGWGWFAYGLGMPLAIWASLRDRSFRLLGMGFCVSFLALMASNRPSPWNMRYFLWTPALFSWGYGYAMDRLGAWRSWVRFTLAAGLVATTTLNLAMTLNYGIVTLENFQRMLRTPIWERDAAAFRVYVPAEYENALITVPATDALGYNVHGNGFIYPLYRADFSQQLIYVPLGVDMDCEGIRSRMREYGLRWLFAAEGHTSHAVVERLDHCAGEERMLRSPRKGIYELP